MFLSNLFGEVSTSKKRNYFERKLYIFFFQILMIKITMKIFAAEPKKTLLNNNIMFVMHT